ncbi:hypothetical protein AS850_04915 [Frondihabitans sp. 762G35]|nr:hypothetical protein AS850_04915 [Frondihabitans sp. 762G35]
MPKAETRSWISIVVNAIKGIPSLLKTVVAGAKNAAAWFTKNVWPTVKNVVGAATAFVTAWDIWNIFH